MILRTAREHLLEIMELLRKLDENSTDFFVPRMGTDKSVGDPTSDAFASVIAPMTPVVSEFAFLS